MSKFDMIVELMVKNGVTTKFSENLFKNLVDNEPIIELDFSEHDKVFEDKIAELKKDYKTASELLGKYQQENESLKQRIDELEKELSSVVKEAERQEFIREMSCLERQELKQRIAELESKESEKTMRIEFHADNGEMLTPLEVANSLINQNTFKVDELRELAEHLQVYCRHHNDREPETISF